MMGKRSIKIRLLAVFVTAFVCLNANAAVCVAYCQTSEIAVVGPPEHYPLKKTVEHCDKSATTENREDVFSVSAGGLDCCPIAVSFFAAPIEKNSASLAPNAIAADPSPSSIAFAFTPGRQNTAPENYRGPPPSDRRELRLRHCILRI